MSTAEKQLLDLFARLTADDQYALLAFAEFLGGRAGGSVQTGTAAPREVPEPEPIERPGDERVVAAVKRLSRTYHMLDKSKVMGETSDLVTQHVLQGREAREVIDELEAIFRRHYDAFRGRQDDS